MGTSKFQSFIINGHFWEELNIANANYELSVDIANYELNVYIANYELNVGIANYDDANEAYCLVYILSEQRTIGMKITGFNQVIFCRQSG